jgi:hypothetical protein
MDEQQKRAVSRLAAAFPQAIVGEAGLVVWEHYLSEVPGDALTEIVDGWVATETRPPFIADLLERWRAKNGTDAESVWRLIERIVRNGEWRDRTKIGGPEQPFGFTGDPALEESVRAAGGWAVFSKATEQDTVWLKKAFMQAYREMSATNHARLNLAMGESQQSSERRQRLEELTDGRN